MVAVLRCGRTYRNRVNVVDEEFNCFTFLLRVLLLFLLSLLHELMVELDEEENLVLDVGKEIVVPNQFKDVGSS